MSHIEVVKSEHSRAFILAALDYEIICTRMCQRKALDAADQCFLDGAPMGEHMWLTSANALGRRSDDLLERRLQVATTH
jgi:hypothetical protein